MKSILLSIKPKWVAKILNGEKTIEIRKKFPKDYRGWVYIYCTKDKLPLVYNKILHRCTYESVWVKEKDVFNELNGKVVARFYCDNVEEYINGGNWTRYEKDQHHNALDLSDYLNDKILEKSCLTEEELSAYCDDLSFSAIHISQLEIFDKPKELSEFYHYVKYNKKQAEENKQDWDFIKLKNPPQNYYYIDMEEK